MGVLGVVRQQTGWADQTVPKPHSILIQACRQYGTTGSRGLQNSVRVFVNKDQDTEAGWTSVNRGLTRVVPVPHTNKRRTGHGKRYHVCGNG